MSNQPELNIIDLQQTPEETSYDFTPTSFDEYLGQEELKKKLAIYTKAARMRNEPLDHLLLFGPPGLGKTTLAHIMAHIMDVSIKLCSGHMLERTGDLVAILSGLQPRDILFIDEIHRMTTAVEEVLYSAMEQFRVDIIIGQGAGAKTVSIPVNPFTLIGATTRSGMLSAPLRSRFGISERIDFYSDESLAHIIDQSAQFLKLTIDHDAALTLARCARGTPRIAKKLLRRIRDFAQVRSLKKIDANLTHEALTFMGIDHDGLTRVDHAILHTLVKRFNGGPAGLETLASLIGEDADTIEEVYEPFLMRLGYLEKTPRGRRIPHATLPHLARKFTGQCDIF